MTPPIRQIIRTRNLDALAEYMRDNIGVTVAKSHLSGIVDQASLVGGPEHDPWSESTWRMWLKGKATQSPSTKESVAHIASEVAGGVDELQVELAESSDVVLSMGDFTLCELVDANRLLCDYPEEVWQQLFPASEAISKPIKEQFDLGGGSKFLGKAPFASWLYARFVYLGVKSFENEDDLGGYGASFVVRSGRDFIGILVIEADSDVVVICLQAKTSDAMERIKSQFITLLLQEIKHVSRCELEVHAAEIDCTNYYGWTGFYFLGEDNASG